MKKFKISTVRLGVLSLISLSSFSVSAQNKVDEMFITGSAIRRIVSDEALPIQVITKTEIQTTGATNVEELMAKIPAIQTLGGTHNQLEGAGGTSVYGSSSPSLRGIGSSYTLVLINGRVADGNLNLIPITAINRIEILTDGASSLYGSDAIAGVINFILATDVQGTEVFATTGSPSRKGGGQKTNVGITTGTGDYKKDGFNITLSLNFEKEKELYAGDRDFAKTGTIEPWIYGAATGQGNIEGAWNKSSTRLSSYGNRDGRVTGFGNSPGTGYGNPMADLGKCADIGMVADPWGTSKGMPFCYYESAKDVRLVPERESKSLVLTGKKKLAGGIEFFGDALIMQTSLLSRYQPNPVRWSFLYSDTKFGPNDDPALLINPSNPNYKTAADYLTKNGFASLVGQPLSITSRVFDFGPRTNYNEVGTNRFVGGFKGSLGEHDWEAAAQTQKSKVASSLPDGYFSMSKFAPIVSARNDWNPWATAEQQTEGFKQAVQAAKFSGKILDSESFYNSVDAKLTGPLFNAPAGKAMYAIGAQYSKSGFNTVVSDALSTGDIAGLGGAVLPLKLDRNVLSEFGEVSVPVMKNLELNGSMRHDNYSDVGGATTYKTSARWKISPTAIVRGSMGTGFKAPGLVDLYAPQTSGTSAQFTDPAFPNNKNQQVSQLSGGNPDLKPENSKQNSIGIILKPVENFVVSLDAWKIDITDKITSASVSEIVSRYRAGDSAYNGLVKINSASNEVESVKLVPANIGAAAFSGVDLNASYKFKVTEGEVGLSIYGTYMNKANETSPSGMVSKKVGTMVEPDGSTPVIGADSGGVIVRWKHLASTSYTTGPWKVTLSQNYYSGYRTGPRAWDDEPHYVKAQSTYDIQGSYTGVKNLKLTAGVKNLADKSPPMYVPVSNQFAAGYDISMYDPRSRFVYLSANYKFN